MRSMTLYLFFFLLFSACAPLPDAGSIHPPIVDPGIAPDSWMNIPAGEFPFGQHDHLTLVDYNYEMMVTDVTNGQFAEYLNTALDSGQIVIAGIDVEAGETVKVIEGVGGYYPGDPFDGYKHEERITPGTKLYVPLNEDGLRLRHESGTFAAIPEYQNHPMTMVSWFGANAYCNYHNWRLPLEVEWEKAARGVEIVDGYGLPFPWGTEMQTNRANYYSSFDLFEKIYGNLGNTTPVGFYNGKTYQGYKTLNAASPFGLYDMAGNVWQWMGDDYPDQHYRYMRGGSFFSYEVDLRVWKNNSAHPTYYSPDVGFRCARDP